MKKEYITPEILLRKIVLESFIADSMPLDDTPGDWNKQEAKEGNDLWSDKSKDVWED